MHNYEIIFLIESMICSLVTIIIKILPESLILCFKLDRHRCLTLITLNKNSIDVLIEKYKDYKDNISLFNHRFQLQPFWNWTHADPWGKMAAILFHLRTLIMTRQRLYIYDITIQDMTHGMLELSVSRENFHCGDWTHTRQSDFS